MEKRYRVRIHGTELDLEQTKNEIRIKDYKFKPEVMYNGKFYRVYVGGKEMRVEYKDNAMYLDGKEIDFDFRVSPQIMLKQNSASKKGADIKAAIPGKIVEIKVKKGDVVKDQDCILVLESMKMRNEILAPVDGIVDRIAVSVNDQVKSRQLLVKIKSQ